MQMTINTGRSKMNKCSKCGAKIMTNMKLNAMDEYTSTTDKVNSEYLQQQQKLKEFKVSMFSSVSESSRFSTLDDQELAVVRARR